MEVKDHECKYTKICNCWPTASSPNEECPIHGYGEKKIKCDTCGKYMNKYNTHNH